MHMKMPPTYNELVPLSDQAYKSSFDCVSSIRAPLRAFLFLVSCMDDSCDSDFFMTERFSEFLERGLLVLLSAK